MIMGLSAGDLNEIEALLAGHGAGHRVLADLRRRFPDLSLTRCDAADLDAEPPFRAHQRFDLYLVDGTDHCWRLTADSSRATGIVVVEHEAGS
jgi:hypothetical protein